MYYSSTRSSCRFTETEALIRGIAPDGGLFMPVFPDGGLLSTPVFAAGESLTFSEIAQRVLAVFFPEMPLAVRGAAIDRLLARFPMGDPTPLVSAGACHVLELFHGPTAAFKDVALSMLPVFLAHAARVEHHEHVMILTATSGDTGSAAMCGFSDVPGTRVMVFYPATGTSDIQRLQMVCQPAENVSAVAIQGNFDDAQRAVKRIFTDDTFRAQAAARGIWLSSANSINIGRLVPQITYYVAAGLRLGTTFDVAVPTGNFGNILAAYFARALGAPIRRFICASNQNQVLNRLIQTGTYAPTDPFIVTNSPSMDIRYSSNVERLLYLLNAGDTHEVIRLVTDLEQQGAYTLRSEARAALQRDFVSGMATPEETEAEIRRVYAETGYLMDPHTAVASHVAWHVRDGSNVPVIIAGTASPCKFPATCLRALGRPVVADDFVNVQTLANLPYAVPSRVMELAHAPVVHQQTIPLSAIDAAVFARM